MNLQKIKQQIKNHSITHLAFIMDGNRRWAKEHNKPRKEGHYNGVLSLKNILKFQKELEIKTTTFYVFSKENKNKRTKEEYNDLMDLALQFFNELQKTTTQTNQAKITILGDYTKLREDIVKQLNTIQDQTKHNTQYNINFCINYDGQDEISHALKQIIQTPKYIQNPNLINEQLIKEHIYTKNFEPPQIIIRTGKAPRLSGFLLWDSAYSEIYFSQKFWPDFNENDLSEIIKWFTQIKRNFGK